MWLIALIVVCTYCGFKAIGNYRVFVVDAYGMTDVEGTELSTWPAWVCPLAALAIELVADRFDAKCDSSWLRASCVFLFGIYTFVAGSR